MLELDEMNKYHEEGNAESLALKRTTSFIGNACYKNETYEQFKSRMTGKRNNKGVKAFNLTNQQDD